MARTLPALALALALAAVVAPAPTAAAESAAESPCAKGARYKGAKINLDVKDADLHNVFRFLADTGGVDIVVPDEVKGTVTLRLRKVPWDQAMCTVARTKKLKVTKEGTIYSVEPR